MNDSSEPAAAVERDTGDLAWRRVIAILAAAFALGLVYNIASPLGVRAPKTTSNPVTSPAGSNLYTPVIVAPATNSATAPVTNATLATNISANALRWVEVKRLLESGQIVLLDARAKTAYDIEHIPGALSLSAKAEAAEFIAFALNHPKDTAIVTYCGSDNCDLSHELGEKLRKEFGFTNVKEMPGGIVEWRVAEGRPTPPGAQ